LDTNRRSRPRLLCLGNDHREPTIPEGLWEFSLGVYCTVKGFRPSSPILRADARVDRGAVPAVSPT
jgi:hypothetical protein